MALNGELHCDIISCIVLTTPSLPSRWVHFWIFQLGLPILLSKIISDFCFLSWNKLCKCVYVCFHENFASASWSKIIYYTWKVTSRSSWQLSSSKILWIFLIEHNYHNFLASLFWHWNRKILVLALANKVFGNAKTGLKINVSHTWYWQTYINIYIKHIVIHTDTYMHIYIDYICICVLKYLNVGKFGLGIHQDGKTWFPLLNKSFQMHSIVFKELKNWLS